MADGARFRKGWSGSPFHLGYNANEGMDLTPDGRLSEEGPRIGPGEFGRKVKMEVARDTPGRGRGRGKGGKSGEYE